MEICYGLFALKRTYYVCRLCIGSTYRIHRLGGSALIYTRLTKDYQQITDKPDTC